MADEDLRPPPPPPVPEMVEFTQMYPGAEQQRTQIVTDMKASLAMNQLFVTPWNSFIRKEPE